MTEQPRVAIATGALRIPPTYFAVQHAELLADRYRFEVFARVADVRDPAVAVPVHDASPAVGGYGTRSALSTVAGSAQSAAIGRYAPDLVHQHFGTWSGPARRAARRVAAPLLTTLHGYDVFAAKAPAGALARWHAANTRAAGRDSARLLAVSRFLADEAIAAGLPASKVQVHYQGIDTDVFTPGDEDRDTPPLVLFVGAFARRKGVDDLLEASTALVARREHRVAFVGAGPLEAPLRVHAAAHPHVTVHGSLDRAGVRALMRRARMLVLPTQQDGAWREAAGLVLLEAQACGTPVVAYDSGGASEMLEPDRTGLVVPEGNRDALATAIEGILVLDGPPLARMREDAREFVVRARSLGSSADELARHYDELLAQ